MTNLASKWLATPDKGPRAFAIDLSGEVAADGPAREIEFVLEPPIAFPEGTHGYEIRLPQEALKSMLTWIRRAERVHGDRSETGGVLFGQIDEFLKIVWIDEVSGPPPDSVASPQGFVCGTAGVSASNKEKVARSSGSVAFVGMWHTHPEGLPIASTTDLWAMRELLRDGGIVGGTSARPVLSAGLYERADYVAT